ncbi:GAF domain-containing sensor histidine kinase [Halalkalibaculum sp. DA3122]|uniref:GAF domain-containing sensor histidine kinase n=1 Tax=Halalkalibaculum sp. DA3122 TaxID=3373607 RepID=UPI003754F06E
MNRNTHDTEQAPTPEDELARILELTDLDLDYTDLEDSLKDLSKLAAHVAGTEISLVNLIDSYTQWSVSHFGHHIDQTPREETICQYTILDDQELEVPHLQQDSRFKDKEFVTSNPELNYYLGIPLSTPDGNRIGALCVLDTESRELTPEKIELLKIISNEIVNRLQSIHEINQLKQTLDNISDLPKKVLHDIKGPVGGIIGLTDIMKDEVEKENLEDIIELIELINKGGKSVLELADELLSVDPGNSQNGVPDPKDHEFNLVLLRDKLKKLFTPQAKSKGVNLQITVSGKNQQLPFPKQKLLQIIGNLTSNAIKFTPEEGNVAVKLDLEKPGQPKADSSHHLLISVKDTGVGMDQEQVKKIQDQDTNMKSRSTDGTRGEKGYGFGIQLVKHLVQTLDGQLEVTSEKGKGSEIKVLIPMSL